MPIFFEKGWEESGLFGDTFGSVNSLFSGFGFIALTYTILLQIKTNEDQRNQDKFRFLYEYFSEIKREMENVHYKGLSGLPAVQGILDHIQASNTEIIQFSTQLDTMTLIAKQVIHYNGLLSQNKHVLDAHSYSALQIRVVLFFINYYDPFEDISVKWTDAIIDDFYETFLILNASMETLKATK